MANAHNTIKNSTHLAPTFNVGNDGFVMDLKNKMFFTDASQIQHGNVHMRMWGKLYSDAADVGFVLFNRTNKTMASFHLVKENRADGEVLSWYFEPTSESIKAFPKLKGWTAVIFND